MKAHSNNAIENAYLDDPRLFIRAYLLVPSKIRYDFHKNKQKFVFNQISLSLIGNKHDYSHDSNMMEFKCNINFLYSFNYDLSQAIFKIESIKPQLALSQVIADISWKTIDFNSKIDYQQYQVNTNNNEVKTHLLGDKKEISEMENYVSKIKILASNAYAIYIRKDRDGDAQFVNKLNENIDFVKMCQKNYTTTGQNQYNF